MPETTKTRKTTPQFAVHFFVEDGFLVRGTLDRMEALRIALDEGDGYLYDRIEEIARPETGDPDDEPKPEIVREFGEHLHALLADAKPGLYRFNVARDDNIDGVAWNLGYAKRRGRGVFEAVVF